LRVVYTWNDAIRLEEAVKIRRRRPSTGDKNRFVRCGLRFKLAKDRQWEEKKTNYGSGQISIGDSKQVSGAEIMS